MTKAGERLIRSVLEARKVVVFPKRCETDQGDPQTMECLHCGAPLGGKCQDATR